MYAGAPVEVGPTGSVFAAAGHPYTQALLAAVPRLTDERGTELASIPGSLPPADAIPGGCRFEARCRIGRGRELCRSERPAFDPEAGRPVACHFEQEARDSAEAGEAPAGHRAAGRARRGRRGARADRRPREELPGARAPRLRPALPARGRRCLVRGLPGRVARPGRRVGVGEVDRRPPAARADRSHPRHGRLRGAPARGQPARRRRQGAPRPRADGLPGSGRLARSDDDDRLDRRRAALPPARRGAPAPPAASRSCSSSSASSRRSAVAGRSSSPAGSGSASRSPARSPPTPRSSSATRRSPRSTSRCAPRS